MKVYEAITQAIQQEGAEIIFGVIGDANQNMLVCLADQLGVRFIPARHEQSAVSMADGYARASGKPGLASVTQGPGVTNTPASLVAANRHGSPLLLLAGDVSLRDPSNAQKIDQLAFSLLTAGAGVVVEHPKGVDYALDEAFRSLRGGWGPFVLNVPQDVQNAEMLDPHWSYLPLSVCVFTDQSVGQERHDLAHKGLPVHHADVPSPDFTRLAQGFGVKGYRVESPDQFTNPL
jgi:acetolactate synthase-1/2/3 large subunit